MASIPENEGPSEAIKNDTATIAKTVETIQDRWVVFTIHTSLFLDFLPLKNSNSKPCSLNIVFEWPPVILA